MSPIYCLPPPVWQGLATFLPSLMTLLLSSSQTKFRRHYVHLLNSEHFDHTSILAAVSQMNSTVHESTRWALWWTWISRVQCLISSDPSLEFILETYSPMSFATPMERLIMRPGVPPEFFEQYSIAIPYRSTRVILLVLMMRGNNQDETKGRNATVL